jgi:hypothetical protein
MQVQLSKETVVDELTARLAARRSIAKDRRAAYERLSLAINGEPRWWSAKSARTQSVAISHQTAA